MCNFNEASILAFFPDLPQLSDRGIPLFYNTAVSSYSDGVEVLELEMQPSSGVLAIAGLLVVSHWINFDGVDFRLVSLMGNDLRRKPLSLKSAYLQTTSCPACHRAYNS